MTLLAVVLAAVAAYAYDAYALVRNRSTVSEVMRRRLPVPLLLAIAAAVGLVTADHLVWELLP